MNKSRRLGTQAGERRSGIDRPKLPHYSLRLYAPKLSDDVPYHLPGHTNTTDTSSSLSLGVCGVRQVQVLAQTRLVSPL